MIPGYALTHLLKIKVVWPGRGLRHWTLEVGSWMKAVVSAKSLFTSTSFVSTPFDWIPAKSPCPLLLFLPSMCVARTLLSMVKLAIVEEVLRDGAVEDDLGKDMVTSDLMFSNKGESVSNTPEGNKIIQVE